MAMRAEAVKLGLVVERKSMFQNCSHDILDSCFGFLDLESLRAAETTCSRWRSACIDSAAGWGTVISQQPEMSAESLSRHSEFDEFLREYHRHRLSPFVSLQLTFIASVVYVHNCVLAQNLRAMRTLTVGNAPSGQSGAIRPRPAKSLPLGGA